MNIRCILFLPFLVIEYSSANAQSMFEKTYRINNQETGISIHQCNDGGFMLGGRADNSAYVIRTDSIGDTLWTKTYDANYSGALSIQSSLDGNYVFGGTIYANFKTFACIFKLDSVGDTLWTKEYGAPSGTLYDQGTSLTVTNDSGFLVAGTTNNFAGYRGFYLLKTNSSGGLQWANKYNSTDGLFDGIAACQTSDGGYAMVGTTNLFLTTLKHMLVIKTDANGDTLWTSSFISNENNYPTDIEATSDGGMIVSGYTNSFGNTMYDAFLLKIDSTGSQQWAKVYGAAEFECAYSVSLTPDSGYLFTGVTTSFSSGDGDVCLVKTDSVGNMQWSSRFGNLYDQEARDAIPLQDGGYGICGTTDYGGIPAGKLYFIKTNANGNGCNFLQNSFSNSTITFVRISIPVDIINTATAELSTGFPISSGGIVNTVCFATDTCSSYTVNAIAFPDSTCQAPIQLNATASTGSSVFEWSPAGNLSNPNIVDPIVNFSFNQDFILTATDTLTGCSATDTVFGISALNDFSETYKTCGSFTYDFFLPDNADSYVWITYTDTTGTYVLNDSNQFITTIPAPCVYYGVANFGGCYVYGTYTLLDTCLIAGLNEINQSSVEIFPNPSNDYIFIKASAPSIAEIQITDLMGKIVFDSKAAQSEIHLSTKEFNPGVYIVTIDDGRKIMHKKIQISN